MNYLERLRKEICEVTFTKANGDERVMICTLLPDYLPDHGKGEFVVSQYKEGTDLITVWDIESDAWRSFKPSKITKFESSPE